MAQVPLHLKLNPEKIQKAAKLKQEALAKHDSLLLAEAYYLYGKAYVFAGDYQTGQAYYVKAIRIHEPLGNSMELSRLYVRLSENEVRVGRLKQALHYATLSLKVAQATQKNKDKALIRAYGALAHVYGAIWGAEKPPNPSTFDRVISYYKKEEQLCYKLNDAPGIAEVNLELGTIFSQVNDPKAIPYLEKAQHLFTQLDKVTSLAFTMMHLAEAYLIFGKPKQAFQTLVKAEDLYNSKKLNNYEIRVDLAIQFVAYFETTRQWDKAFRRLRKLNELERIRLLADHDGALTRLSMEYETEKKETLLNAQKKEINLNAQNLQLQKYFTLATFALFVIAAGMSVVFFRLSRKNQRISHRNVELIKEQNHRVKNNLQVVSSLLSLQAKRLTDEAAKKAVEESRLRVQSMAIIHRKLYDGDKLAVVNLDEFIQELVNGVLKSFGYPFATVQYAIDTNSLSADKAIPLGLILNELITNACKYAFPQNENPHLTVSCYAQHAKLYLQVTDNGPGLEVPVIQTDDLYDPQTKSFGMSLIQAQVMQLNGSYQFSSADKTEPTGTTFTMEFKL